MKLPLSLLLPAVIAVSGGLIEMRVAVGRLETQVSDVDHRVTRIEQKIDNGHNLALTEDQ